MLSVFAWVPEKYMGTKGPSVSSFELSLEESISQKAALFSFPSEDIKGHLVAMATNCSIYRISLNSLIVVLQDKNTVRPPKKWH